MVINRSPRGARRLLAPVLTVAILGYFGFHAFIGNFGLLGAARMQEQLHGLDETLAGLRAERARLEAVIALMRPSGLDRDIVDERLRFGLNLVHRNDTIILR